MAEYDKTAMIQARISAQQIAGGLEVAYWMYCTGPGDNADYHIKKAVEAFAVMQQEMSRIIPAPDTAAEYRDWRRVSQSAHITAGEGDD